MKELKAYYEVTRSQKAKTQLINYNQSLNNTLRIDPPLLNNTNCNFYYNAKIYKLYSEVNPPSIKSLFSPNLSQLHQIINQNNKIKACQPNSTPNNSHQEHISKITEQNSSLLSPNECDLIFNKVVPNLNNKNNNLNILKENTFYVTTKLKLEQRNEIKSFLMKISDILSKHSILKDIKELKLERANSNKSTITMGCSNIGNLDMKKSTSQ